MLYKSVRFVPRGINTNRLIGKYAYPIMEMCRLFGAYWAHGVDNFYERQDAKAKPAGFRYRSRREENGRKNIRQQGKTARKSCRFFCCPKSTREGIRRRKECIKSACSTSKSPKKACANTGKSAGNAQCCGSEDCKTCRFAQDAHRTAAGGCEKECACKRGK